MICAGLERFSLIDYPGKSCAIIFTLGCNMRCPYCHNPELVSHQEEAIRIDMEDVFLFLETRRGKLDAVTITGGEPTLHHGLLDVVRAIKDMGFSVKLDSNGTRPDLLRIALAQQIVDYIAMDIKAPFYKYDATVTKHVDVDALKESISLIKESGVDHEFRTTIVRSQLTLDDLLEIGGVVQGARRYYLQRFVPSKLNDPSFMKEVSYSLEELEPIRARIAQQVGVCGVR
jgi:pyruvate formate lyase activating enzyme